MRVMKKNRMVKFQTSWGVDVTILNALTTIILTCKIELIYAFMYSVFRFA